MKKLNLNAFLTSGAPATLFGVLTDGLCVTGIELPELDEDDTARLRKRSVSGSGRIAQVAPGWIVPVLIGEDTLQHKNLFTASVCVGCEVTTGSITHNARGSCDFFSLAVQLASLHASSWGRRPGHLFGMQDHSL